MQITVLALFRARSLKVALAASAVRKAVVAKHTLVALDALEAFPATALPVAVAVGAQRPHQVTVARATAFLRDVSEVAFLAAGTVRPARVLGTNAASGLLVAHVSRRVAGLTLCERMRVFICV